MTRDAPDQPLELGQYRGFLRLLVQANLDPRLRGLLDPSDLVQETLLRAHAKFHQFQGATPAELRAWLRSILANETARVFRKHLGERAGLEQSLHDALDESSVRLDVWLAGQDPSPSQQVQREERLLLLLHAIDDLPEDQRTAIELRYLQGRSPTEVADLMGRTTASAAGLLRRALFAMREALGDEV